MSKRLARAFSAALIIVLGLGLGRVACALDFGDAMERPISVEMKGATAEEVSRYLTVLAGVPVVFVPIAPEGRISVQVSRSPLGEFLKNLSKLGAVAIGGQSLEFQPDGLKEGPDLSQRVSLQAKSIDAAALSRVLTGLLRTEAQFQPTVAGTAGFRVDLDIKNITLRALLQQLKPLGTISLPRFPTDLTR